MNETNEQPAVTETATTEAIAAAAPRASIGASIARLFTAIDDRLNPVVVRELRQAVGGKFVSAILLFFLAIQSFALGMVLLLQTDLDTTNDSGYEVFMIMRSVVLFVSVFAIPAYAGFRFSAERTDANADLLNITTLHAGKLVSGKFFSAMLVALLIYAASAPFLSLTFLLRGIDIPTIITIILTDLAIVAISLMGMIFAACVPAPRILRWLIMLAGLGGLFTFYITAASGIFVFSLLTAFTGAGTFGTLSVSFDPTVWYSLAIWYILIILTLGFLQFLGAAMLTPLSANRAFAPRLYTSFLWAATLVCAVIGSHMLGDAVPLIFWLVIMIWLQCIGLFISASERDTIGLRIKNAIPRSPVLRIPAFLLYSGSAGGLTWNALVIVATLLVGYITPSLFAGLSSTTALEHVTQAHALFSIYIAAYVLLAVFTRRSFLSNAILPINTYAIALILMGLGTILPLIMAVLMPSRGMRTLDTNAMVTIPFTALTDYDSPSRWIVMSSVLAVFLFLNIWWMLDAFLKFKPAKPEPAATTQQTVAVPLTSTDHTSAADVAAAEAALQAATKTTNPDLSADPDPDPNIDIDPQTPKPD